MPRGDCQESVRVQLIALRAERHCCQCKVDSLNKSVGDFMRMRDAESTRLKAIDDEIAQLEERGAKAACEQINDS